MVNFFRRATTTNVPGAEGPAADLPAASLEEGRGVARPRTAEGGPLDAKEALEDARTSIRFPELAVHQRPDGYSLEQCALLEEAWPLPRLDALASTSQKLDRGMGALVGLAVADAAGHPLEFIDAGVESGLGSSSFSLERHAAGREPYINPFNKFRLSSGQWTDDCSMALCLADSLLQHQLGFCETTSGVPLGSDVRLRFWSWWHCGLNNAFRNDGRRNGSVGLGGNISRSLLSMAAGERPTPTYEADTTDAGNGSLMRLAPVALFHWADAEAAARDAAASSYTTHPGPIAAEACQFLAHLLVHAMRDFRHDGSEGAARRFLVHVADAYEHELSCRAEEPGVESLRRLLRADEPDGPELCWNWRGPTLRIDRAIAARGRVYNGYPVSAGYFGSFCRRRGLEHTPLCARALCGLALRSRAGFRCWQASTGWRWRCTRSR
jgi:ADP-ribosylglycohydrolase